MTDLIVIALLVLPLAAWLALPSFVFRWLDHEPEAAESETDRLRRQLAATEAVALMEGRSAAYWQTRATEAGR